MFVFAPAQHWKKKKNATFELFSPHKHANLRSRSMLLEDGDGGDGTNRSRGNQHLLLSFVLNKLEKTLRALSVNPKCDFYLFHFFFFTQQKFGDSNYSRGYW